MTLKCTTTSEKPSFVDEFACVSSQHWCMGTQFILLAFLNSVAAACGGETVHHWSGIPIDAERGSQDMQRFALKLQAMRVIVLDEFPMISAELMGKLERSCRRVHGIHEHIQEKVWWQGRHGCASVGRIKRASGWRFLATQACDRNASFRKAIIQTTWNCACRPRPILGFPCKLHYTSLRTERTHAMPRRFLQHLLAAMQRGCFGSGCVCLCARPAYKSGGLSGRRHEGSCLWAGFMCSLAARDVEGHVSARQRNNRDDALGV